MSEDTFRERNREFAEKRARISILLERISYQEGFKISDEELDKGLQRTAEKMNQPYEKVKDFYQKNNMMNSYRHQLLEDKVISFLRDQADISEVDTSASGSEEEQSESEESS